MMRPDHAFAALAAVALGLAGCGGGGSTAPAAPAASTNAQNPLPATAAPLAFGQLTLRFPSDFHVASKSSAARSAASQRTPAFVDPTAGAILDVYIGSGSYTVAPALAANLDGTYPTLLHSATVAATADGTQTLSRIPLFSSTTDIVAVEWDASHTKIYAVGEATGQYVTPGTTANLSLTMQMNVQGFALTTNANGSAAVNFSAGSTAIGCSGLTPIYFYPTDYQGGYTSTSPAPVSGAGGIPAVTISAPANNGATHLSQNALGTYSLVPSGTSLSINASATNPAWQQIYSTYGPGIYALRSLNIIDFSSASNSSTSQTITVTGC